MKKKNQRLPTSVWSDIQAYFKKRFEDDPELIIKMDEDDVVNEMEARFGRHYQAQDIATLLRNGFYNEKTCIYTFRHDDFFPQQLQGEETEVQHA